MPDQLAAHPGSSGCFQFSNFHTVLAYTPTGTLETVLAVWTFIHPAILAHANRSVQQLQLAKPSKGRAGDPIAAKTGTDGQDRDDQDRVQDLRNHLNDLGVLNDAKCNDMVPIIKQRQQATCIRLRTWSDNWM